MFGCAPTPLSGWPGCVIELAWCPFWSSLSWFSSLRLPPHEKEHRQHLPPRPYHQYQRYVKQRWIEFIHETLDIKWQTKEMWNSKTGPVSDNNGYRKNTIGTAVPASPKTNKNLLLGEDMTLGTPPDLPEENSTKERPSSSLHRYHKCGSDHTVS